MTESLLLIQDPTTALMIFETPILFFFLSSLKVIFYAVVEMLWFWLLVKILFVYTLPVKQSIARFSQQALHWEAKLLIKALEGN